MTDNPALQDEPTDEDLYPLTREKLFELAWSEPMVSIGKRYDVSSSFLGRICTRMNVPRPAVGYWTKIQMGKTVAKPDLPKAGPEDELEWDRNNDNPHRERPKPKAPAKKPRKISKNKKHIGTHRILGGAKAHFLKTRQTQKGYLRPYKKILVDIIVSQNNLNPALKLANQLLWAFEDYGYRVAFSPSNEHMNRPRVDEREEPKGNDRDLHYERHWGPYRSTMVYIGDVAFGLTLIELSKNVEVKYVDGDYVPVSELKSRKGRRHDFGWTNHQDMPSGKFCLQVYSPYGGTGWVRRFNLPSGKDATRIGHKIAKELNAACPEIVDLIEKEKIRREEWQREWEESERRREQERLENLWRQANTASREQIDKIITDWSESRRIDVFFEEVDRSAQNLPNDVRANLTERIEAIMKFVGRPDALAELQNWCSPFEIMASLNETLPDSASTGDVPA